MKMNIVIDLLVVLGAFLISTGAYLVYKPLGFIALGVFCILAAFLFTKAVVE